MPQRTANAKKLPLCSEPMPCKRVSSLGQHLPFPSSTNGLLFCHLSPHRVVSVHTPEQLMKLQLLQTAATPLLRPLCLPGAVGTKTIDLRRCNGVDHHAFQQLRASDSIFIPAQADFSDSTPEKKVSTHRSTEQFWNQDA